MTGSEGAVNDDLARAIEAAHELVEPADSELDKDVYDQKRAEELDAPDDAEWWVKAGTVRKIEAAFTAVYKIFTAYARLSPSPPPLASADVAEIVKRLQVKHVPGTPGHSHHNDCLAQMRIDAEEAASALERLSRQLADTERTAGDGLVLAVDRIKKAEARAQALEAALRHIQGMCGNPDAKEGCRLIIKRAERALAGEP